MITRAYALYIRTVIKWFLKKNINLYTRLLTYIPTFGYTEIAKRITVYGGERHTVAVTADSRDDKSAEGKLIGCKADRIFRRDNECRAINQPVFLINGSQSGRRKNRPRPQGQRLAAPPRGRYVGQF